MLLSTLRYGLLLALGSYFPPAPLRAQPAPAAALLLRHVTVIDTRQGHLWPDRDVLVVGDRIQAVTAATVTRPPAGTRVVDGRGKFLMPGLWDCHIHLSWTTEAALPLLTALGVTNVRDLGGNLGQLDGWRAQIAAGMRPGPTMLRVGPILNGKAFNQYQFVPGTVADTRATVRLLAYLGVDAIKVHRRMPREWYFAALDEARKARLPLVGHVPMDVSPAEAVRAGQATIEHTETLLEGTFSAALTQPAQLPGAIGQWLASAAPDSLAATFRQYGAWLDPTLVAYFDNIPLLDPAKPAIPLSRYVARSEREQWAQGQAKQPMSEADWQGFRTHVQDLVAITARLHRQRVRMLAGTDAAGPRVAGFSLHQELGYLVQAGLSPLEALQAATLNPAIAFHQEADLGAVEAGKVANLVLLTANPLVDITNTQRIAAVIQGGRLYERPALDQLLRAAEQAAAQH